MTNVITEPALTPDAAMPVREPMRLDREVEGREVFTAERPITFEEWLDICGPKDFRELIGGVLVEQPPVYWDHEQIRLWLLGVLACFVKERGLGIVLGPSIALLINEFRGRLPEMFFTRKDRMKTLQQKAVYGPPDLVI